MKTSQPERRLIRLSIPIAACVLATTVIADLRADCPATTAVQRATTDPYQHVRDMLVTDENVLDGHGREPSVNMDLTASYSIIAFENIDAENNGIFALRFLVNSGNLTCICALGDPGTNPPIPADECPLRLDAPDTTNDVQHRHASTWLEWQPSGGERFFTAWQATPSGGTGSVLIQPRSFEYIPPIFDGLGNPAGFTTNYFGQVSTPTTGTGDRHPSAGLSDGACETEIFQETDGNSFAGGQFWCIIDIKTEYKVR